MAESKYDLRKVIEELKKFLANITRLILKLIQKLTYQAYIATLALGEPLSGQHKKGQQ